MYFYADFTLGFMLFFLLPDLLPAYVLTFCLIALYIFVSRKF